MSYNEFKESNELNLSPLLNMSNFLTDFSMYTVYLGIVRIILRTMCFRKKGHNLPFKLSVDQITVLNKRISDSRKCFPSEFQRKPRTLNEIEHFKATEYRTYILYFGPFVFKHV